MSSVKRKKNKQTNKPATEFSLAFLLNVENKKDFSIFIANSIFKNPRIRMDPSSYNYSEKFN